MKIVHAISCLIFSFLLCAFSHVYAQPIYTGKENVSVINAAESKNSFIIVVLSIVLITMFFKKNL